MSVKKKLSSGEFVVLAEMDPPKGVDVSELLANAGRLKERVDGVVIPDMDNGVMRMSAIGCGALVRELGMEAIVHVYGRDRNRMALQGDVLAAYALGLRTLVVVNGEEMAMGDHRDAKPVDDLDALGLINAVKALENGADMAGLELTGSPMFNMGVTIPPCGDDAALDAALKEAEKKVAAGAGFIMSPPVFDIPHFMSFMEKAEKLGVPVIPTVFLLKSVGIARYMAQYEPGVRIPEDMIKRIRKAPDREKESIRIAGETVSKIKGLAQGVKIQAQGWEHRLPEILDCADI